MSSSISRQHIYLFVIALFLFIFVLVFSFSTLIPSGKEYRAKRIDLSRATKDLRAYSDFHDETFTKLKDLQSANVRIITAFETTFSPQRFEEQNKKFFTDLSVQEIKFKEVETEFVVYEVNTTSKITSPTSFYDFLDSVNKSDWIIQINFPINFVRDAEMIKSSFTMKVYANNKDKNSTALVSVDK